MAQIIYRFTRNHKAVVHVLAFIFLPGTIIHELAHLLFAGVMLVPVGELSVIPEIEGKSVKLGSVQIGHSDPFRRTIVGVAPVLLGMTLIFSIFLFVKIGVNPWWHLLLALYLIFQIGNTMFSSRKDIEGSVLFLILVLVFSAVILLVLYLLNPELLHSISKINLEFAVSLLKQASVYLVIPVALDLLIIFLAKLATSASK